MSSELEERFKFLDSEKAKEYTEEELYNQGKSLDYRDRIKYDYKMECVLKNESYKEIFSDICHESDFIRKLIKNHEIYYMLCYIEDVIKGSKGVNKELFKFLRNNYDKIPFNMRDEIDNIIIEDISFHNTKRNEEELNRFKELVIMICNPKHGLLDLEGLGRGSYANIYKLNDYIIKVCEKKFCKDIPYSDYLLLPYFKGDIGEDFIEITDYLDNDYNIDNEELYKVYKGLRDEGIMWADPSTDNIRRINRKALDNQHSKKYLINQNGIYGNPNHIKRDISINDIVIIDLDHMVFDYEKDKYMILRDDLENIRNAQRDVLERRYLEEKKVKVKELK